MSESVIADFLASFAFQDTPEPERGRVVLSQKRLVLAGKDSKTTIPLSSVFDVSVGRVTKELSEFFDHTVAVGYRDNGTSRSAIIECEKNELERFTHVLFKALLNGSPVLLKHPARVGGRVMDTDSETRKLKIEPEYVGFKGKSNNVKIEISRVIGFEREQRTLDGDKQGIVSIRSFQDGDAVTTEIALPSNRETNLFGRFVRQVYSDLKEELQDVSISDDEIEVLVAIYTAGSETNLARVLDADSSRVTMLINSLREKGLVEDRDGELEFTNQGLMVVSNRVEAVNV
jgi:helix-turn-helix protein